MNARVLVVDDESSIRFTLRTILEDEDIDVDEACDGVEALARLDNGQAPVDLIITDLKMPNLDGMGLLDALRTRIDAPQVVMITAHGDERVAVEAMKHGALDYFAKPFDASEILRVVQRALAMVALHSENRRLRAQLVLGRNMVFRSAAMFRVAELVERVAGRDVTVLITGETGTGKELVAEAIVQASKRSERPFVRFNCAALPTELAEAELFGHQKGAFTGASSARRGLIREADGGTLLLDEIDSIAPAIQGALLRVLQEREVRPVGSDRALPVDVRLIAASGKDLAALPTFRSDLYYRLNVVPIHLPPLRKRPDDIAPLARHFARMYGERFDLRGARLTDRVIKRLQSAAWPGNVRELEHAVQRLVALADTELIDADPFTDDAQVAPAPAQSLKSRVDAFERKLLVEALVAFGQNKSQAARSLKVSRVTLLSKLKKYQLM